MGINGKVILRLATVESSTRFEPTPKQKETRTANLENILQFIKPKSITLSTRFVMQYKAQKNKRIGLIH